MKMVSSCVLALIASVLLLTGCAAPQRPEPGAVPNDFALAVSVYGRVDPGGAPRTTAARYVMEPDGLLRVATDGDVGHDVFPPITRRLTPAERDELWRLADAAGIVDPGEDTRIESVPLFDPPAGLPVAVTELSAGSYKRYALVEVDADPAVDRFLDRLAELGWVR